MESTRCPRSANRFDDPSRARAALVFLLLLLAAIPAGCSTSSQRRAQAEALTEEDLFNRLSGFATLFSAAVQGAADRIIAQSRDPEELEIHRKALQWKLTYVPECRRVVYAYEPRTAFVFAWVLCADMERFLTDGKGKDAFGPHQQIAIDTAKELEEAVYTIGLGFLPKDKADEVRAQIKEFSKANPIVAGGDADPTAIAKVTNTVTDSFAWIINLPLAPFRAFGGIDEGAQAVRQIANVARRATAFAEGLPNEARWQVEVLLLDLEKNALVQSTSESVRVAAESSASLAKTAENLPERVGDQVVRTLEETEGKLEGVRTTLEAAESTTREIQTALDKADGIAGSVERTSTSFAEAGRAWDQTLRTFGDTYRLLSPEESSDTPTPAPSEPPGEETPPFDINDYTKATESATAMAAELRGLLDDFNRILTDGEVEDRLDAATTTTLDRTTEATKGLIDYLTVRAIAIVAAILAAALGYRLLAPRLARR